MSIKYLSTNKHKIIFNGLEGQLMNDNTDFMMFVNKICRIDTKQYEYIYKLSDNWAGCLLLIKGNKYRSIECGSGLPLILSTEKIGELTYID